MRDSVASPQTATMLAFLVTVLNLGSYLGLYTAYSKANKKLELNLLLDADLQRPPQNTQALKTPSSGGPRTQGCRPHVG